MSEKIKDEVVEDVAEVIVEDTEVEATVETPEAPLTEARTVSAIQASMTGMSKEGLDAIFEAAKKAEAKAKVEDDEEEEDDEGDEDEGDVEEGKSKKEQVDGEKDLETKAKKKKVKADDGSEIEVTAEKKKFKEDVEALIKDEDTLSEGFKAKAETIFEAALQSKIISETAKLEERYTSDLAGEVEAIKEDLVDKVDGYLTYVVENWMKDNEVAIEHSLKSEITESFIDSLGQLFSEHHINVPSDKGDILDALSEEAKDAKAQLNDATANAAWSSNVITNLYKWGQKDPYLERLSYSIRLLYFQNLVLLEDMFMDRGHNAKTSKNMALSAMNSMVGPYFGSFN